MKKRWMVLVVIVAIAVPTVIFLSSWRQVPEYQGQTVYDWMFSLPSSALESSPGLMAIGSNAVPYLAEILRIEQTR